MNGLETSDQAAWVIASLPVSEAELVLRRLPTAEADGLRSRVADLERSNWSPAWAEVVQRFIGEFSRGGATGRHRRVDPRSSAGAFHFLRHQMPSRIAAALVHELPQTAAAVLTQLTPHQAADVLAHLAPSLQREIADHLRDGERVEPAILRDLAESLEMQIDAANATDETERDGAQQLSEILACADDLTRHRLGSA